MKSTVLWALIILNAVLLVSFLGRVWRDNTAMAQPAAQRRPGDYVMVPVEVIGASSGIVVVVDQTNGELSAMTYDDTNKRFDHMAKVDLQQVFQRGAGGRSGGR